MALPSLPPDAPTLADGRFVLVSRIGAGAAGAVYRGYDRKQRGWRAFRVLTPPRPEGRERFARAAGALAAVAHPNVVRVYEVAEDHGVPYAVMELVTGGTLAAWIERHGAMPAGLACGTALELARGLAAVHAEGLVHGGVRAGNGLVTPSGVRKLGDPGLAGEGDVRGDLLDLGRLIGHLCGGAPAEASLAWIADECGEALDTADAVADALEAILGQLPAEPPGTPDPVLDLSGLEVALRPGNHPELDVLAPPPKPLPSPPPAARRWIPDPGDYDDQPRAAPAGPHGAAGAEDEADADTVLGGAPAAAAPPPVSAPEPAPQPEPVGQVQWDQTEEVDPATVSDEPGPVVDPATPAPLERSGPPPRSSAPEEGRRESPPRANWRGRPPIPHARAQPPEEGAAPAPAGKAAAKPASGTASQASAGPGLGGCLRLMLVPAALGAGGALLGLVLLVVTIGSGAIEVTRAGRATSQGAEQLLLTLDQHRGLVDRLAALGADRARLDGLLEAYHERRGRSGQLQAALALADGVEDEAAALLDERTTTVDRMELHHQVRSLRAVHHRYDQSLAAWEAASETWRGWAAVGLGIASPPGEQWAAPR